MHSLDMEGPIVKLFGNARVMARKVQSYKGVSLNASASGSRGTKERRRHMKVRQTAWRTQTIGKARVQFVVES